MEAGEIGWGAVLGTLLGKTRGYRGRLTLTFGLGIARVTALIGVGVLGALAVAPSRGGNRQRRCWLGLVVVAPLAGVLHWLESWLAHDVAYRLLADMRLASSASSTRWRRPISPGAARAIWSASATHDVELIEYFFAHTVTPALVAVLIPVAVLVARRLRGPPWPRPPSVPSLHALVPVLGRARIDRLELARPRGLRAT